jgi:alcohol dehydrogenase class IV
LPKNLTEAGITEEQFDSIVAHAKHDGAILTNAKRVTAQDIRSILEASK